MRVGSNLSIAPTTELKSAADAPVAATGENSASLALRDPDVQLMLQVQADEPGAFEQLVARYQNRLVAVMTHLVGNLEEAEDLAQEVFLRVYRARHRYQPRSKFATWLFTIANNLARNSRRTRQRSAMSLNVGGSGLPGERPEEQWVPDPGTGPMQHVQKTELAERIRAALDTLNERQRTAVVLNKFQDLNYAGVAEVMGVTTKAVKSLLARARINLRVALSGYVYMDGEPMPEVAEMDE